MKYLCELRRRFRNSPAFTITDLKVLLKDSGISTGYLSQLVHNLLARGEIKRISKGVYTYRDDMEVAGFAFRPFYYGLQEALSLRNLWEQETNPVVITPRKVRPGVRAFAGGNFVVKRIARGMFFGFEMLRYQDFWIPVSDVEKTLIDFIYFKEPLGAETMTEIKNQLDRKKLADYLKRCPQRVKKRINQIFRRASLADARDPAQCAGYEGSFG
ncbi:TPA: hypothetical protein HA316_02025, partial [Candidatus Micrarchaeota archaeon]|nr:hypothetical protein [Candidatus Micrarchaeota archaeon]